MKKKIAQTSFLGGFWGEEHGEINDFQQFRFSGYRPPSKLEIDDLWIHIVLTFAVLSLLMLYNKSLNTF